MLDYKYVLFLLKEEKLLLAGFSHCQSWKGIRCPNLAFLGRWAMQVSLLN